MNENPIQAAIVAAGRKSILARRLGITHAAITRWQKSGRIPAVRVLSVEKITGIDRCILRPDLYPPEDRAG